MGFFDGLLEEEILLDEFGNRRNRGYGRGNDIVSDVFQTEAVVDLMEGNDAGFVEDEILADIF